MCFAAVECKGSHPSNKKQQNVAVVLLHNLDDDDDVTAGAQNRDRGGFSCASLHDLQRGSMTPRFRKLFFFHDARAAEWQENYGKRATWAHKNSFSILRKSPLSNFPVYLNQTL